MTHTELIEYVIRNANYLDTDSFGFGHYRRPDYIVARHVGIAFHADPKSAYLGGTRVLANRWVMTHDADVTRIEDIQKGLAETFGAPNFHTLIENWTTYVKKYESKANGAPFSVAEYGRYGFIVKGGVPS